MRNDLNLCPVCGFRGLSEPYVDEHECPSHEICPCCGTEFGYDDATKTHVQLRIEWIESGSCWTSKRLSPPKDWDAKSQLRAFGSSSEID